MNDIVMASVIAYFFLRVYQLAVVYVPFKMRDGNDAVMLLLALPVAWASLAWSTNYDVNVEAVLVVAALADVFVFLREFLVVLADLVKVDILRRNRRA